MDELWRGFVEHSLNRLDGPLHFRFIAQPMMAVLFATLDGWKDARLSKPAYFWALVVSPGHRRELLTDGWKHFGKIFILAIILDIVYQLRVHYTIYPVETIVVALILAVVPYVLVRGPVNRIVRIVVGRSPSGGTDPVSRRRRRARGSRFASRRRKQTGEWEMSATDHQQCDGGTDKSRNV